MANYLPRRFYHINAWKKVECPACGTWVFKGDRAKYYVEEEITIHAACRIDQT